MSIKKPSFDIDQSSSRPLKVRVGGGYALKFIILHGQRNAQFIQRRFLPLHRICAWADAIALVPECGHDLVHTFNAVPLLTKKPYLITFEDFMPRVPEDRYIKGLESWLQERLCADQCVALIAMSEYARRQFLRQNRSFRGLSVLKNKLQVIYPALRLRRETPKNISDHLHLIFVGTDYMRKGLPALLKAHQRLRKAGIPVRTTILSGLKWSKHDYIGPPFKAYVNEQRKLLSQEGIELHPFLPYEEANCLVEKADYMVFPTFHDTFGFATLDALSCATPAIVTGTCAQPEIIEDGECGYVLPFENEKEVGKWIWTHRNREPGYFQAYDQAVETLSREISQRLIRCWEERKDYERLSAGALNRIRTRFSVEAARDRIEQLYELCRGKGH